MHNLCLSLFIKKDDRKIFSKDFTSQGKKLILIKLLTGTKDDVFNFAMIAKINKGSYDKLSLKGNFSERRNNVEMTIYKVDKNKKTLQVFSDRASPFVKNFDFIKGFEGGKLKYESVISKGISNSDLTITDFKVSKVPALAQLLTLSFFTGYCGHSQWRRVYALKLLEMKSNSRG